MNIKKIIQISMILILSAGFSAKSFAQAQNLTLQDAIGYALKNKAEAKKAKLAVQNSNYQIEEVRSRALPNISASGNITYNPILQLNALPGDFFGAPGTTLLAPLGQEWVSTAGVNLNQTLFDQSVFTGLKAAKTTREFYQINAQLTEEQVIERVANGYYQVFVTREQVKILNSNLENTNKVRNIINGQYENGLAKKIDLDRMTVNVSNIRTQLQQAQNAVQLQENALKFYIGMPIETPIVLTETEIAVKPVSEGEITDVTQLTEYLVLDKQSELLRFQKKSVQAEFFPRLSLTAGYNYIGQGPEFPWFAKPSEGVYWSDFSTLGLSLSVPIFNGFGTRAKVRQAEIEIQQMEVDKEDTKLALDLAFENAKTQMINSIATIEVQQENVQLAKEVLANTQNNYQNGLATLTDLLDAENSSIEAQTNYNSALLDYKLAEIQLIKSRGQLKSLINP